MGYASRLVQNGWEHIAEALKIGGVSHMMDRLANEAKLKAYDLAEELKFELRPLLKSTWINIEWWFFSRHDGRLGK